MEYRIYRKKDNQVKIRGYRIELGEIEHCVVKERINKRSSSSSQRKSEQRKRTGGVYYADGRAKHNGVKKLLKTFLPDYMIPAYYFSWKIFLLLQW